MLASPERAKFSRYAVPSSLDRVRPGPESENSAKDVAHPDGAGHGFHKGSAYTSTGVFRQSVV